MKQVPFSSLPVGSQFKERLDGAWHLKISRTRALYKANGCEGEPSFDPDELVFIEA